MAEPTREADRESRSLSGTLLEGKLAIRPVRRGAVSRRALIERARASDARVVGVTAPAGFGKSTLLSEWAAVDDRMIAWATIDRFDDDPAALLTLLATASAEFSPSAGIVASEMRGLATTVLGRSAPMLAAALSRASEPFLLVIDDIHSAASDECHDALEVVLAGVPSGSQVVLASRAEQPYFARLRIDVPTLEIGTDELRLDGDAARVIFAEHDVEVDDDGVGVAVERCEGWPTGLVLYALAVKAGADVLTVGGDERFVAEYLYHECLAGLPPELQDFLRRTAVLDELSAELCDAMLDRDDSGELLRRIEALNLFLIPLDRRELWFRYHALFREFLLADLRLREHGIVSGLHVRAAEWLEGERMLDPAVEHLLAAGEVERAGELVAELALPTYQRGEVAVVERWLDGLGDAVIEASPALAVIAAWAAILQGKSPASERWAAALDRFDLEGAPEEDRAAFESARAMVRAAMCAQGWESALADARLAAAYEPAWSPWRDQALHLLGSGLLLAGDRAGARDAFVEASESGAQAGNADSVLLSEAELAILSMDDGDWSAADAHAHAAVRAVDDNHMEGYPTTALALAVSARLAQRRGDAAATDRFLVRAMRARVHCTHVLPFLAMRTRLQIAGVLVGLGDRTAARHMLREIDDLLARYPDMGTLADEIARFRSRLDDAAMSRASIPLTPAELRLLPYLQTHLTIAEIGQRLFISRNTVSSEVGSIYRKLGVTTRGAAVERAIEMGLLGG
ncbi:helix-turn-helix transcriptional regulator [Microbacterium sp.]|uniref:helix-turn-helix transcriptional regulator n=1 Tax=Microbacterium sp. TaxID=51671 RepID=UPI002BAE90FE|nr:LuxR C-terminal-related transcriptional regulator [Microbacterium sp.]HWL77003.1 LuxR C-terminal-related transcriptional regulator [Microbacterium sp.]